MQGDTSGYFCLLESGNYIIGSVGSGVVSRELERSEKTVTLSAPILIARYPITIAQWMEYPQGKDKIYTHANSDKLNLPITNVPWVSCIAFCKWLSHYTGQSIRLPFEDEWEAAACGKGGWLYSWGNTWQNDCIHQMDRIAPVGCYPAGSAPCGVMDMLGNVWEMTQDQYPMTDQIREMLADWLQEEISEMEEQSSQYYYIARGGEQSGERLKDIVRVPYIARSKGFTNTGFRVVVPIINK